MKELFDLFLGLLSVYCITEVCTKKEIYYYFIKIIKIFIGILSVIALMEIFCGIHLSGSRYAYPILIKDWGYKVVWGMTSETLFLPTTIFYGVNDFAAFLAIFFPLFFVNKTNTKKEKIRNIVMMIIIVFLLVIGDANIALLAVIMSIVFMAVLNGVDRYVIGQLLGVVCMQHWISNLLGTAIIYLKKRLANCENLQHYVENFGRDIKGIQMGAVNEFSEMTQVVISQVETAKKGSGSLYTRIMLMQDALDMWLASHLMGVGPKGFSNYLKRYGGRTKFVNPHNYWFEILAQYGIFVFIAYVGILFTIFLKNMKSYLQNKDFILMQIMCIIVSYIIASVAPSNFLGYSYQWVIWGMGLTANKLFSEERTIS